MSDYGSDPVIPGLPVAGLVLPPLMVGIGQGGSGSRHLGNGGDQRDQLAAAEAEASVDVRIGSISSINYFLP